MVGPHITSAAAEAAVNALCEETSCSREIFNADDDSIPNGLWSPTKNCETERLFIQLIPTDAPYILLFVIVLC